MRIPHSTDFSRLKTPAPIIREKKNSFLSAPRIVSGRFRDRNTGLTRVGRMLGGGKEPGHEIDGADGHADAEDDAGESSLTAAFPKRENQAGNDDRHKGKARRDRTREGGL